MNKIMREFLENCKVNKLYVMLYFLISRLDHKLEEKREILLATLVKIALEMKETCVWWLLPLKYFDY